MPTERINLTGSRGQALAATLDEPEKAGGSGDARAYALFAHCFTCSQQSHAATRIARGLAERGLGVMRFDFTGIGASAGDFAETTFASNLDDLRTAHAWLQSERRAPSLLVGHSLGGAAVLAVAGQLEGVRAVATIGAPADPAHVTHLFGDDTDRIRREGSAEVSIGGRPFRVTRAFVEDLEAQDPAAVIGALDRDLMIFHSPVDQVVGIDNAARIFEWARHPKSFISLGRADHLLTDRADAEFVAGTLAAWADRVA